MLKEAIAGLSDENVGLTFIAQKAEMDSLKGSLEVIRDDILGRVESRGEKNGKNKTLRAVSVEMKKEVRTTQIVKQAEAVALLERKKLDYLEVIATISVKEGVDVKKIPKKVLTEIEKYFVIEVDKSVPKDMLKTLEGMGKLTKDEVLSVMEEKETVALKVVQK
jgi:hypothetical protein